jgi:hypothetical protein
MSDNLGPSLRIVAIKSREDFVVGYEIVAFLNLGAFWSPNSDNLVIVL